MGFLIQFPILVFQGKNIHEQFLVDGFIAFMPFWFHISLNHFDQLPQTSIEFILDKILRPSSNYLLPAWKQSRNFRPFGTKLQKLLEDLDGVRRTPITIYSISMAKLSIIDESVSTLFRWSLFLGEFLMEEHRYSDPTGLLFCFFLFSEILIFLNAETVYLWSPGKSWIDLMVFSW